MPEDLDTEMGRLKALVKEMHGQPVVPSRSGPDYDPRPAPGPANQPGRVRFLEHEVRRIPVLVSLAAQATLTSSSSEGRKLPQALAEAFATLPEVQRVVLDVEKKSASFPLSPEEAQDDPDLLVITAEGYHPAWHYTWRVYASRFTDLIPSGPFKNTPRVSAAAVAKQLLAQYPHRGKADQSCR